MQRLMMATEAGKRHRRRNQNWHLAIWLQSLTLCHPGAQVRQGLQGPCWRDLGMMIPLGQG